MLLASEYIKQKQTNIWAPHLKMSHKRFTMATIALSSASEQTNCALVVCDPEWVTVELYTARFEYPPKTLQRC